MMTDRKDLYGTCKLKACECKKRGSAAWLGRLCPNWQSANYASNEDMMKKADEIYRKKVDGEEYRILQERA